MKYNPEISHGACSLCVELQMYWYRNFIALKMSSQIETKLYTHMPYGYLIRFVNWQI